MSNANASPTGSFGPEQAEDIRRQFIQRAPEGSASAALDAEVLACFDSAGYGRHPKVLSLLEALHANKDLTEVRKLKKAAYQLLDAAQFVDGSQERKVKNAVATAIDAASDRLIDVLDQSGALESERVQRAAYQLRLAVVQAIGDPGRISAAEQSLRELDGEGAKTLPHPSGPGCVVLSQGATEEAQEGVASGGLRAKGMPADFTARISSALKLGADPFDQSQHEHDRPRGG